MLVDSHLSAPIAVQDGTSRPQALILPFPQDRVRQPQPSPLPVIATPSTDLGVAMGKLREAVAATQKALAAQHAAALALAASVASMRTIADDMIATNGKVQQDVSGICSTARGFRLPTISAD